MKTYILLSFNVICSLLVLNCQEVIKLSNSVNSSYDEVTPILSKDEKALYFTRIGYPIFDRSLIHNGENVTHGMSDEEVETLMSDVFQLISGDYIVNPIASRYNQDIWVSELDHEYKPTQVHHLSYPINNIYPNSVLAVHNNSLLVINEFTEDGAVYEGVSTISMNLDEETFPKALDINDFYTNDEEVNLTINKRGDVIIWALNRGDHHNSRDLYVSFLVGKKYWTAPKNLGNDINTNFRESTPFLASDDKRLYFSSDRPGSLGKMDIYYADRLDYSWRNWSDVKRLPEPINSEFNDSQPCLTKDENYVFFSSDRGGNSDIYLFDKNKKDKILEEPIVLNILVIDSITRQPLSVTFNYGLRKRKEKELPHFFRSSNGRFTTEIKNDIDIEFKIIKPSYEEKFVSFGYWDLFDTTIKQHNLVLEINRKDLVKQAQNSIKKVPQVKEKPSIVKNPVITEPKKDEISIDGADYNVEDTYILKNIYFVQSKAQVLKRSHAALESLYQDVLKKNEDLHILISGHTDNVGDYDALMKLSKDRASMIKSYLIDKGISSHRLHTKGYGPDKPLNENKTDYERRMNRRVEITFLNRNEEGNQ